MITSPHTAYCFECVVASTECVYEDILGFFVKQKWPIWSVFFFASFIRTTNNWVGAAGAAVRHSIMSSAHPVDMQIFMRIIQKALFYSLFSVKQDGSITASTHIHKNQSSNSYLLNRSVHIVVPCFVSWCTWVEKKNKPPCYVTFSN